MFSPPRFLLAGALVAAVSLSACGGRDPFQADSAKQTTAADGATAADSAVAATTVGGAGTTVAKRPAGIPPHHKMAPLPTTPGDAPSPAGTTPGGWGVRHGTPPTTLAGRIAADETAMLNVRTMVSIVEGCHSGHASYRDCNTHKKLGSPAALGVTIGPSRGQVQITASKHGFRMTGKSLSGAKFTVARGPRGDRFKCIPGPKPGACPTSGTWNW